MGKRIIYTGKKANKKRNIPDEQHTPNKKAKAKAGSKKGTAAVPEEAMSLDAPTQSEEGDGCSREKMWLDDVISALESLYDNMDEKPEEVGKVKVKAILISLAREDHQRLECVTLRVEEHGHDCPPEGQRGHGGGELATREQRGQD